LATSQTFALAIFVAIGWAQLPAPSPAVPSAPISPAQAPADKPVLHEPYSADRVTESEFTDTNTGREHSSHGSKRVYRDAAGRTRVEDPLLKSASGPDTPPGYWLVTIDDPVAGARYVLDVLNRIAHRQVLPPAAVKKYVGSNPDPEYTPTDRYGAGPVGQAPFPDQGRSAGPAGKKLGKRIIEGIEAEGIRYTWGRPTAKTPPARTEEIWRSPELKVTVLSIQHMGTMQITERLTHIDRAEPDPALFQAPAGYSLVDEYRAFTVPFPVSRR